MNSRAVNILAKRGITPATKHHDYQYLFKAVIQAMEEYADGGDTNIVFSKVGDTIELHFKGDVTLIEFNTDLLNELLERGVTLVAYSGAFENPTPHVRMEDRSTFEPPSGRVEFTKKPPSDE